MDQYIYGLTEYNYGSICVWVNWISQFHLVFLALDRQVNSQVIIIFISKVFL